VNRGKRVRDPSNTLCKRRAQALMVCRHGCRRFGDELKSNLLMRVGVLAEHGCLISTFKMSSILIPAIDISVGPKATTRLPPFT
jgi:hypothetical protein